MRGYIDCYSGVIYHGKNSKVNNNYVRIGAGGWYRSTYPEHACLVLLANIYMDHTLCEKRC